jgi:hypothetical protein
VQGDGAIEQIEKGGARRSERAIDRTAEMRKPNSAFVLSLDGHKKSESLKPREAARVSELAPLSDTKVAVNWYCFLNSEGCLNQPG